MSFTVVIPARKASTRLPNKPLLDLDGQSLVQRVYVQEIIIPVPIEFMKHPYY